MDDNLNVYRFNVQISKKLFLLLENKHDNKYKNAQIFFSAQLILNSAKKITVTMQMLQKKTINKINIISIDNNHSLLHTLLVARITEITVNCLLFL